MNYQKNLAAINQRIEQENIRHKRVLLEIDRRKQYENELHLRNITQLKTQKSNIQNAGKQVPSFHS